MSCSVDDLTRTVSDRIKGSNANTGGLLVINISNV